MKVYKKKELSLSVTPFGIADKQYLAFAVMVFFDLNAPDALLTDQDLWRDAPPQLGPVPIIDTGMPKQQAEFLVAGSCFAPRDTTVPASRIRIQVGNTQKILNIFGDRFFMPDGAISIARPFSQIPLVYENAFGGEGFSQNPIGKGMHPIQDEIAGYCYRPLPNIEHPARMIGGPKDQPAPTSLGMLDPTWAPRSTRTGTYDDRWLAERWPNFPDDMDYAFFNTAQEDQWNNGFYTGNEPIEIENMHPDIRRISSHLPGIRVRLFPTLIKNFNRFHDPDTFQEEFTEVKTQIDTVWLFPTILRGLCIFRGTTQNIDDEYYDVPRVYVDFENLEDPLLPIEEYHERQRKAMNLSVPIDMAPFEAASKNLSKAMKTLKNSPKEVARVKKAVLGQEPAMPRTANEIVSMSENMAQGHFKTLDQLESVAKDLHSQFGHMAKIDLTIFDTMRNKVKASLETTKQTALKINASMAKANAVKDEILTKVNASMDCMTDPKIFEQFGLDRSLAEKHIDMNARFTMPEGTGNPWHDSGFPLVVDWRRALESNYQLQDKLRALGLSDKTVRQAWMGINTEERREDPVRWGLAKPAKEGTAPPPEMIIPAGLVMPRFDGPILNRILIRKLDSDHIDIVRVQEELVSGSAEVPLSLPPSEPGGYYVRVADELQALFMEEEIGDACGVVALEEPGQTPDDETTDAITNKEIFLLIMPEGTTHASPEWKAWYNVYPNAKLLALPTGQTVFDARAAGIDMRNIVMEALPKEFATYHSIDMVLPEAGKAPNQSPIPSIRFPAFDFAKDTTDLQEQFAAKLQPEKDRLLAFKAKADKEFAETVAKSGKTMEEVQAQIKAEEALTPRERYARTIDLMKKERDYLAESGTIPPEKLKQMDAAIGKVQGVADDAAARHDRDMARLAEGKKQLADAQKQLASRKLPGKAGEEMAAAGLDPDIIKPMTVEEVLTHYQNGRSFARRNLCGLDLSGLSLPGINLAEAMLDGALFVKTDLSGANLKKALAPNTDFTKADLSKTDLTMGVFTKAKLKKAQFKGARLYQTLLQDADLTKANFQEADLNMAMIQNCPLSKASFIDSDIYLTTFHASPMVKADFRKARLRKSIIRMLDCSKVQFDEASLNDVMLHQATGEKVSFHRADLTRFRSSNQTQLPGADFTGAIMHEACIRETDIPNANFSGCDLSGALFELCDMTHAKLKNVPAKGTSLLKCDLTSADMSGINLMTGSLRKSNLLQTNISNANLYAVDLYKVIVGKTNFDKTNLKLTALHRRTDLIR